ncbi:hypothetical protein SUGI_1171040 [Cryptomeria japonica]|nr:hypothetical protein SUGI_1171040 [Cryptomeria japonica]
MCIQYGLIIIQRLQLENEEHNMLSIHDIGGAEKSLLLQCMWNNEDVQKSFENDALIWVTVSSGQISWMQRTIAEQVHMAFDQTWSEEKGKAEIFWHLETKEIPPGDE